VKAPTQNDQVLEALLAGDVLTPLDALRRFGCFRLAARVADLRARGFQIETVSGEANGKRFAQYRLVGVPPLREWCRVGEPAKAEART
jgi:hypothetical protein